MKLKHVYLKTFSKIEKIQQRRTIEYNVYESQIEGLIVYGVHLKEKRRSIVTEKIIECVSCDYCKILDILQFLYENSIGPVNVSDIVEDLMDV